MIISYVRTQIAGYKCPKTVDHINELPRNPRVRFLEKIKGTFWEGKDRTYLIAMNKFTPDAFESKDLPFKVNRLSPTIGGEMGRFI